MKKVVLLVLISLTLTISNFTSASIPMNTTSEDIRNEQVKSLLGNSFNDLLEANGFESELVETETTEHSSSNMMDEELIITLLLWFFLGFLAAHRWYRGKPTGWNILFILTAGGCGVWAIIDLVHILTGRF
jgi:hypothetical protein